MILSGNRSVAEAYAGHVLDVVNHYNWRYQLVQDAKAGQKSSFTDLADDDSWQDKYFEGSFLASRDQFFFPQTGSCHPPPRHGPRVDLKEHLLGLEGVPTVAARAPRVARRALYHYDTNPAREYCLPTCGDIAQRPIDLLFATREHAKRRVSCPSPPAIPTCIR